MDEDCDSMYNTLLRKIHDDKQKEKREHQHMIPRVSVCSIINNNIEIDVSVNNPYSYGRTLVDAKIYIFNNNNMLSLTTEILNSILKNEINSCIIDMTYFYVVNKTYGVETIEEKVLIPYDMISHLHTPNDHLNILFVITPDRNDINNSRRFSITKAYL